MKFNSISLVNKQTAYEQCSYSEVAQSSLTEVTHLKKRKRGDEEASGSDKTSPDKRRRENQNGGER